MVSCKYCVDKTGEVFATLLMPLILGQRSLTFNRILKHSLAWTTGLYNSIPVRVFVYA